MNQEYPDRSATSRSLENFVPVVSGQVGDGLDIKKVVIHAAELYIDSVSDHLDDVDLRKATSLTECQECNALFFMLASAIRAYREEISKFVSSSTSPN